MHKDIVYNLPEGTELLGYTPKCEVQGFYSRRRVITVQGHPEFTGKIVTEIVTARHSQGIFDDEMYQDAIARVHNDHDGVAISRAFLQFLLDD
jgi:GMP synthase-like glutamine amidotransferase